MTADAMSGYGWLRAEKRSFKGDFSGLAKECRDRQLVLSLKGNYVFLVDPDSFKPDDEEGNLR